MMRILTFFYLLDFIILLLYLYHNATENKLCSTFFKQNEYCNSSKFKTYENKLYNEKKNMLYTCSCIGKNIMTNTCINLPLYTSYIYLIMSKQ